MATKEEKGIQECPAGTVLFREGDLSRTMYVIKAGAVRLSKRVYEAEVELEELQKGAFCGELAMISDQPRSVTATVSADATLISISAGQFEKMLRGNSDIAVRMMQKLTQRLTQAQYRVANFALRTTRGRLLHQLRHEARRAAREGKPGPARIPANLADVLGVEIGELKALLSALVRQDLISVEAGGAFEIVDADSFDRYLRFLELHDRFEYAKA